MKTLYTAIKKAVLIMSIPLVIVLSALVSVWLEIEVSRKRKEDTHGKI